MAKFMSLGPYVAIRENKNEVWVDIQDYVCGAELRVDAGELSMIALRILAGEHIKVDKRRTPDQIARNDLILLAGVDISDHVGKYIQVSEVGNPDVYEIHYQLDDDTIEFDWNPRIIGKAAQRVMDAKKGSDD